jgi:hypothetical protein
MKSEEVVDTAIQYNSCGKVLDRRSGGHPQGARRPASVSFVSLFL